MSAPGFELGTLAPREIARFSTSILTVNASGAVLWFGGPLAAEHAEASKTALDVLQAMSTALFDQANAPAQARFRIPGVQLEGTAISLGFSPDSAAGLATVGAALREGSNPNAVARAYLARLKQFILDVERITRERPLFALRLTDLSVEQALRTIDAVEAGRLDPLSLPRLPSVSGQIGTRGTSFQVSPNDALIDPAAPTDVWLANAVMLPGPPAPPPPARIRAWGAIYEPRRPSDRN